MEKENDFFFKGVILEQAFTSVEEVMENLFFGFAAFPQLK